MLTTSKEEELAAIRSVSLDYWESWYQGDAERMKRSLHPDLAKRHNKHNAETGADRLVLLTRDMMVTATQDGEGTETPLDHRDVKIDVLDIYETIASVRCEAYDYIEYLHLAKADGHWQIVNTLYTRTRMVR